MDKLRHSFLRFGIFWTLQGVWVWTVSLPATLINAQPATTAFAPADVALIYGALMGLVIENVADQQKYEQRIKRKDERDFMKEGIWSMSRHPNYFGEMTFWWCTFLLAYRHIESPFYGRLAALSPILTMTLLMHVSGLPFSEVPGAKKQHKLGNLAAYEEWRRTTSPIIPMPSAFWTILPRPIKWLLGEWKRWEFKPEVASKSD